MDIYFEGDDQAVYNLEMQNANYHDLPLRSRYYQSLIDVDILERGQIFLDLKASYVIFLCRFDPFGRGLCRYTFQQTCEELPELPLDDKAFRLFLNTKAAAQAASPELCALLDYVDGREATTDFTQRLDHYVKAARSKEDWKVIYLKQHSREETIRREAEARGEERGEKRGISIGEDRKASDIARNMKSSGMPASQIAELTGLKPEEVEAL
jgi:predicted transposase/invertase (TIGR01784 family)